MKKIIFGIAIGVILCCGVVYAASYYAKDISYEPSDASWVVSNVNEALNELHNAISDSSIDNLNVDILATAFSGTYYENGNQRLDITLKKDYKFIVATGSVKRTYAVGGVFLFTY